VETGEATVLFDTGGDSPTLLSNMARLGFDPPAIDAVVLSHSHDDHVGGLMGLLETGARPTVYVPATFPTSFKDGVRARTDLVEITGPAEILPGLYTTGGVDAGLAGAGIVEQALVVETGDQESRLSGYRIFSLSMDGRKPGHPPDEKNLRIQRRGRVRIRDCELVEITPRRTDY